MTVTDFLLRPFTNRAASSRSLVHQVGMSLLEILIVISLIGTIMTIVITQLTKQQDEAQRDAARLLIGKIQQTLQMYRLHNSAYPTTDQGLQALIANPGNARNWRGPYIEEEKLSDPWGQPLEYESDGANIKITSKGPDTALGTDDDVVYPAPKQQQGDGG